MTIPRTAWKPGQSGNPSGRPRGIVNQAKLRTAITNDLPDIIARLTDMAKAGDVAAARLLLDRTVAPLKASDQPAAINLPPDLAGAATGLLQALGAGRLTPDQAAAIAGVLSTLARVHETTELEQRIAALEDKAHA